MTINPNFRNGPAAAIQPIKANFRDAKMSTQLSVSSSNDDFVSTCTLEWQLMDDDANVYDSGSETLTGTDYTNWTGANLDTYPYTYIATLFNLTFI